MKKNRGCKKPISKKKNHVWKIDGCYLCSGENKKCVLCNGSNIVPVYQCPRSLARNENVSMLLPYFQRYLDYGVFPDGGAIIDQPVELISTLEIFVAHFKKYEAEWQKKKYEEATRKNGKT